MTIKLTTGDLLEQRVDAIVNAVNTVGVMGKGIALQFKRKWPGNARAYEAACKRKEVVPGKMFVFDNGGLLEPKFIINFPTKRHWRQPSRMTTSTPALSTWSRRSSASTFVRSQFRRSVAETAVSIGMTSGRELKPRSRGFPTSTCGCSRQTLSRPTALDVTRQIRLFGKLKLQNCAPIPGLPAVGFFACRDSVRGGRPTCISSAQIG